jgi:histidinol phosphatase-like enzyme
VPQTKVGLLKGFMDNVDIDLRQSFVCGDRQSDEGLAENIGDNKGINRHGFSFCPWTALTYCSR